MELNPAHREVLQVSRKRYIVKNDYTPSGKVLASFESAGYLGITIPWILLCCLSHFLSAHIKKGKHKSSLKD